MSVAMAAPDRVAALEARLEAARRRRDHLGSAEVTGGASFLAGALCCAALRLRLALAGGRRPPAG